MYEWLILFALVVPFSDAPVQQSDDLRVVASEENLAPDSTVNSGESTAEPQCCGPNPLPPPGGGQ